MDINIRKLKRTLDRNRRQAAKYAELEEQGMLTDHGQYSRGYFEGKVSAYEYILDIIEESL
tara:strand:- start:479 stop:661 length:183 start_codon:yes stop_codon:yes gene_type:complete